MVPIFCLYTGSFCRDYPGIYRNESLDSKDFDAQSDLFSSPLLSSPLFCSFCAYYSFFPMYVVVNPFSSIQSADRSMHPTSKICRKVVIKTN